MIVLSNNLDVIEERLSSEYTCDFESAPWYLKYLYPNHFKERIDRYENILSEYLDIWNRIQKNVAQAFTEIKSIHSGNQLMTIIRGYEKEWIKPKMKELDHARAFLVLFPYDFSSEFQQKMKNYIIGIQNSNLRLESISNAIEPYIQYMIEYDMLEQTETKVFMPEDISDCENTFRFLATLYRSNY